MADINCQNPGSVSGFIDLGILLALWALEYLQPWFNNPIISILITVLEVFQGIYTKNAAYAGMQLIQFLDPENAQSGIQFVQWATDGAPKTGLTDSTGFPNVVIQAQLMAVHKLANKFPTGIFWSQIGGPYTDDKGKVSYVYKLAGFFTVEPPDRKSVVNFDFVSIDQPIDPATYKSLYGFPVPSADDLAAFYSSKVAKGYNDYKSLDPLDYLNVQTVVANDLLGAYNSWYQFCHPPKGPPPPPPPGGGGGGCDPTTLPPPPAADPDGDELTDLTNLMAQYLWCIAQNCACGSTSSNGDCCNQLVASLEDISAALLKIVQAIQAAAGGGSGGPPVDLTPIVDQLTALVAALRSVDADSITNTDSLVTAINKVATAIADNKPTDVQGIVDQLKKVVDQGDVDQAIFDALSKEGLISPDDLQTLQGIKWSDAVTYITSSAIVRAVEKWVKDFGADPKGFVNSILNYDPTKDPFVQGLVGRGLTQERNSIQTSLSAVLDLIKSQLVPGATPSIGNVHIDPDRVLANVVTVLANIQVVATLVSLVREGAGEQLFHFAEKAAALLGFEELREVQLGPLVRFGIARVAEMQARLAFRQELPGASAAADLEARGLIDKATYELVAGYDGLATILTEPTRQGAYSGMNPRILMRLVDTGLFTDADITDELTFTGMRPASQHRFLSAAAFMATDPQRKALETQIESAYQAGLLSDSDLLSNLDSAEGNTDKHNLILAAAKWKLLIAETKLLETEYATMYEGGLIDDPTYRGYLAGIGLQPSYVDIRAGVIEARVNARLQRQQLAEAARADTDAKRKTRSAAMKSFTDGLIDEVALAASLTASGLTLSQVVAWTALAALQKSGNAQWLYGLQLQPDKAKLLRERVQALGDQRKRQLISDAQYVAHLKSLGIPDKYINALRATTDAMISPKSAAILIPVATN